MGNYFMAFGMITDPPYDAAAMSTPPAFGNERSLALAGRSARPRRAVFTLV
jgi:hypothetical protein